MKIALITGSSLGDIDVFSKLRSKLFLFAFDWGIIMGTIVNLLGIYSLKKVTGSRYISSQKKKV